MPAHKATLGDQLLLTHCQKNAESLGFLTRGTKLLLEDIVSSCKGALSQQAMALLDEKPQDLDKLWASLLMDAIHALKLRDRREKAWCRGFVDARNDDDLSTSREQNVYGITVLKEYFDTFTDYERVLYGADDKYRDHVVHVVRTWLIGVYIMTDHKASVENLVLGWPATNDAQGARIAEKYIISKEERWAMWTIIALCHDLGYPLEKTHKINDVIEQMLSYFGNIVTSRNNYSFQAQHQSINDATLRILSSKVVEVEAPNITVNASGQLEIGKEKSGRYLTKPQAKYYTKFAHSLEEFKHGIISCLVLMKTLVYFLETDYDEDVPGNLSLEDARQFHIRREILRAIAAHTCTDVYHLQINTLPFMLIVCDELQEWGRPILSDMKLGHTGSTHSVKVFVEECNFKTGEFSAQVEYAGTTLESMKARLRRKFQDFHKLMRAALDDENRNIDFRWKVTLRNETAFEYVYNSHAGPFAELKTWEGKNSWDIYESA